MINSRRFTTLVNRFDQSTIRQDIVDMITFCAVKFHADNNTDPLKRVEAAPMTQWVKNIVLGFKYGKRDESLTEEALAPMVFEHVVLGLADHNDELVAAKAARKARRDAVAKQNPEVGESAKSVPTSSGVAKPSAPKKTDTKAGPVTQVVNALMIEGQSHTLTVEEAKVAMDAILALRASKSQTASAPKRKTGTK